MRVQYKFAIACIYGIFFWFPMQIHALYFGNLDAPELVTQGAWICNYPWMDGEIGYEIDNVFNRRIESKNASYTHKGPFKMRFNQGVLTAIGLNRAELYTSLGVVEMDFSAQNRSTEALIQFQTNDHFTWGIGGRLILSEWEKIVFGIASSFQHAQFHFSPTEWGSSVRSISAQLHYYEWQVGGGMATTFDWCTPYMAVKYSYFSTNVDMIQSCLKFRSAEHFGLVVGFSLAAHRAFSLTVEARLFDEESISGAWSIRF